MWQPEQCCRGIKPLTEYKWENLRDSSLEQIICHCQVCIVSASFLKKKLLLVSLQMRRSCRRKRSVILLVLLKLYFEKKTKDCQASGRPLDPLLFKPAAVESAKFITTERVRDSS